MPPVPFAPKLKRAGAFVDAPAYVRVNDEWVRVGEQPASPGYYDLLLGHGMSLVWALDDVSGASDLTGAGNDGFSGTITPGGAADSPIAGQATSTEIADGDFFVTMFNPFGSPPAFFCGWMKRLDSGSGSSTSIFFGSGGDYTDLHLGSGSSGGDVEFWSADHAVFSNVWPNPSASPEEAPWVFWVLVVTDESYDLYINGELAGSYAHEGTPFNFGGSFNLGGCAARHAGVAVGFVELSAGEIAALYAAAGGGA